MRKTDVKKQVQETVKEVVSEVISHVKIEMINNERTDEYIQRIHKKQ